MRLFDAERENILLAHAWCDYATSDAEMGIRLLAVEPEPRRTLDSVELDDALTVAADFIDLKSPHMAGHIDDFATSRAPACDFFSHAHCLRWYSGAPFPSRFGSRLVARMFSRMDHDEGRSIASEAPATMRNGCVEVDAVAFF
jgi:hypothetical protein